jgi:multiple sugar transport system substrate-binding protein
MDNNQTIFENANLQKTVPAASEPTSKPPVANPKSPPDDDNKLAPAKKIFKIFLGLFALIAVIIFIFVIVLPLFNKSSSGKVTLTYWGLWEDNKVMQGVISDFERQNPNIKIDYSKQDVKQYRERLISRMQNGTGPDIFRFHNTWYPMFSDILLPFPSDVMSKDDFAKIFYPVAKKDLVQNGAIYGVPLEIDTLSLYVNTQLLQAAGLAAPTNWNDFVNDARAMTVKDENGKIQTAGAAMGTYDNITHAPDIVSLLFLQNGVDLKNLPGSADRATGALTFYTSFATDQNNVWDATLDPSMLAFSKGNLAMYFGYSWDYFTIKQANPDLVFQIVPVPQLPNENISMASYWVEGASLKSKHQKEAFIFLKFLASKEVMEKIYADEAKTRAFGEPYSRVELANLLKDNQILSSVISQAPGASSSYFVDGTFDNGLNQQANGYLGNAINSIIDGGSAQTAFNTLSQGVTQVMQKYGQ